MPNFILSEELIYQIIVINIIWYIIFNNLRSHHVICLRCPKISKTPLYERIYQAYRDKILNQELLPETQLPTEMDLMQEFNVSRITVIRALKELESAGFIHRIQGSGSYVTKGEWEKKSGDNSLSIISLVIPFDENFKPEFLKGIEAVAKENGYFVTFHHSTESPHSEQTIISEIIARGSQGIILYPADSSENRNLFSKLLIQKYPLVLIDRKITGMDLSIIRTDNHKGFYDITSHLLELGHERIIFVGTSVYNISSEMERYEGFCAAHIDHCVPLQEKHLYSKEDVASLPIDYRPELEFDHRAILYLLDILAKLPKDDRPTAIAAVNDIIARLIIISAQEKEISIPGDYSVTGFDDRSFARHLPVPLTTIAQPIQEIGRIAASELINRIRSPNLPPVNQTVEGSLIVRKSTEKLEKHRK